MTKADDVRVQDHAEIASALMLGSKLQQTVGQEGLGVFQPRPQTRGREHQEKLIVKMIVVGQGEQGARRPHVRRPVVGNIIGETVTHVRVASVEQQVDGVRADGADRKRIALAGQGTIGRCPVRRVRLAVAASMRSHSWSLSSWLTSSCLKPCAATSWPCSRIVRTVVG